MLSRLVRGALLLELAAYVAFGACREWSAAAIAVAIVAAAAGVRLALVCATMAVGAIAGSPRPAGHRIGPAGAMRLVLGEWRALLAHNFFYLPFESLALRPDPAPGPADRIPILLVHGYFSNRGYFRPLAHRLERAGFAPVFVRNFSGAFAPIERFAEELHARIEEVARATGQARVVLVCHSMGGLAARQYLCTHGAARVARLVTLGSPHAGTVLAAAGVGENARQMRRGSVFLEQLAACERDRPTGCPTTSIYSVHDNLVAPQATSHLEGARNIALAGLGHITLLLAPRICELVLEELREAGLATASG